MNNSLIELKEKISEKLLKFFFVDDKKYGVQNEEGKYHLLKDKISPNMIDTMLGEKQSLLTYQELHISGRAFVKWVCFDIDIVKAKLEQDKKVTEETLEKVQFATEEIAILLQRLEIPFVKEFSGRRGYHIWVIFEDLISKENAYYFVNYIKTSIKPKIPNYVDVEIFPKIPKTAYKSKGIGYGVKLPLSYHRLGVRSYFIQNNYNPLYNQNSPIDFYSEQLKILNSIEVYTAERFENDIVDFKKVAKKSVKTNFLKVSQSEISYEIELNKVLSKLRNCSNIRSLLAEYEKGLNNKSRLIMVGLLIHLKTRENKNYGKDLLHEFFSRIQNYNPEITRKLIENLDFLNPVTCEMFGEKCEYCSENNIISPIEILDDKIILTDIPKFTIESFDEKLFKQICSGLYNYSSQDEVRLYFQLLELSNANFKSISKNIDQILNHENYGTVEYYQFFRQEKEKVRTLYTLETQIRIISVYFTYILNKLYYPELSDFSFGYIFQGNFYKDNLFENWFVNWAKFSKNIENILFSSEYSGYYLVKLDISKFYDRIDLDRLEIKLFEELPHSTKTIINSLNTDEKNKYKRIVDYLIFISKKIATDSKTGLPQGPAYARYLAEIYLNSLDKIIEQNFIKNKKREFYYRFVDDIFVFVESKERALVLNSDITQWLSLNNLEINNSKTTIQKVSDYVESGEYSRYQDDAKYDLSKANKKKDSLSEIEIEKIIKQLTDLAESSSLGLKDNLRFFYRQFEEDDRLKFIKRQLSNKLPFNPDGRGTLYYLFYTDLAANSPDIFLDLKNKLAKLPELSLSNYLNAILTYQNTLELSQDWVRELIINFLHLNNTKKVDQLLIAILKYKYKIDLELPFDRILKEKALKTPEIILSHSHFSDILQKLERLELEGALIEIYDIIHLQNHDLRFLNKLADYYILRFSVADEDKVAHLLNSENNLERYYKCISFLTLFVIDRSESEFITVWKYLLSASSKKGEIKNFDHQFRWTDKVLKFKNSDLSFKLYGILVAEKQGSPLSTFNCKNHLLSRFKDIVLMLVFSKSNREESVIEYREKQNVLKASNLDKNSLFYKWVQNKNAVLYPKSNPAIPLKIIGMNGLIVLRDGEKFFIKNVSKTKPKKQYDYLEYSTEEYLESGFEIENNVRDLLDNIKILNFYNFIIRISDVIRNSIKFKDKYSTGYPVFYENFESSGVSLFPIIPFYSDYSKFINYNGEIVENNYQNFKKQIFFIIEIAAQKSIKTNFLEKNTAFDFELKNIENRFIPSSALLYSDKITELEFILKFAEILDEISENDFDIFNYQFIWSSAVLKLLKIRKENIYNTLINYLSIHQKFYSSEKLDILFAVDKKTNTDYSNLLEFQDILKNSMRLFKNEINSKLRRSKNNITNSVEELFDIHLNDCLKEEFRPKSILLLVDILKKFRATKFSLKIKRNHITDEEQIDFLLDDVTTKFENAYFLDLPIKKFIKVSKNQLRSTSFIDRKLFLYHKNDDLYIIRLPNEILKCHEQIEKRKTILNDLSNLEKTEGNLNGMEEITPLFPKSEILKLANSRFSTINRHDFQSKLENHYLHYQKHRIIDWLTIFNENSIRGSKLAKFMMENDFKIARLYDALLDVIELHQVINQNQVEYFEKKIKDYNSDKTKNIIIPIKNNHDENGFLRLMNHLELNEKRDFDWLSNFERIGKENLEGKKLIIVTDICITGGQTSKALKFYISYGEYEGDNQLIEIDGKSVDYKKERYFKYNDKSESTRFKENFKKFKKIVFLSPFMTNEFESNIKANFWEYNTNLQFDTFKKLNLSEVNYETLKNKLNKDSRDLFEILVKDFELIDNLFHVPNKKKYKKQFSKGNLDKFNLILRKKSLPARHFKLFTFKPKLDISPLFDYVPNWND
ncbi:reverse transcriptase domain-containing protein [Zunongwangia atlantica]|uniref:Reverse transcriptase domain-containing protein n=1 Tax=Zunongwangia atlantica 22II14-10F7 TaxID=1185767 RepID=A0A1Y1T3F1_9FLAO|nr:reverse transcriptase domain-containing protein [Zunongwangia atlantica]ORL45272.1 hypothetical protein IIF7_10638 [Zunongwangia atlantica 22II14-10F7]